MKTGKNKIRILFLLLLSSTVFYMTAQVTIGASKPPENFSALELISNGIRGIRLPQMTTDQRNAVEASTEFQAQKLGEAMGLQIFNTVTRCVETWDGTEWIQECGPDGPYVPPVTEIPDNTGVVTWTIPWVGAFWKDDQTGERIIRAKNTTSWTITIDDNAKDWVVVDNVCEMTTLWTENPDDAELHQVGGNDTLSGTGDIFFRFGLKSTNPNPVTVNYKNPEGANGRAPRYGTATLIIDGYNDPYKIFLRQGESSDYVFRPTDLMGGGTTTTSGLRDLAVKISPYNLTNANLSDATGVLTGYRGGTFVDFPTQNAFWQWGIGLINDPGNDYLRMAYNPGTVTVTPLDNFSNYSYVWDDYTGDSRLETCPEGWRRPTVGDTSTSHSSQPANGSELMQSLFEITSDDASETTPSPNSTNHRYWGYYADGFFDRRSMNTEITPSTYGEYAGVNAIVSAGKKNIAFIGLLYTNPATNASLFMPASGMRFSDDTALYFSGDRGMYWSSSRYAIGYPWQLQFTSDDTYLPIDVFSGNNANGMSIRCVQE